MSKGIIFQLIKGVIKFIPGVSRLIEKGTGGTDSARYCYSVWLRHLIKAKQNGLPVSPKTIAEFGPGDSLGVGLAGLISGCEQYLAFDVVEYSNTAENLKIFDELVILFKNRADVPGKDEFPLLLPLIEEFGFPEQILTEKRLTQALAESRLEKIRESIRNHKSKESVIQYKVPWHDAGIVEKDSVDMIYSQAVLEHVDDLANIYDAMRLWLKKDGFISHQIDFKCHGVSEVWNDHWTHSDFIWKLIVGKKKYFLNREPHSTHISLLTKAGFTIICDEKKIQDANMNRSDLASCFDYFLDEDMQISDGFIQAVKTP